MGRKKARNNDFNHSVILNVYNICDFFFLGDAQVAVQCLNELQFGSDAFLFKFQAKIRFMNFILNYV